MAQQPWPAFDEAKCKDDTVEIVVQVGARSGRASPWPRTSPRRTPWRRKAEPKVAAEIAGKSIVKEIYVPGKLVNIVAR